MGFHLFFVLCILIFDTYGGTFTIASGDDTIHAEDTLTITAGKIDIPESYEGLEALHID